MLLPSAGLICNRSCLTIGKVMMDTDAPLSTMALTGCPFTRMVVRTADPPWSMSTW